jgi:hypothetical protein
MTKAKMIVLTGNVLLALAWPIGFYVGSIFMKDSDPAGRGYAEIGGIITVLLVTYIPVTIIFIITRVKWWSQLEGLYKFLLYTPVWVILGFIMTTVIYGLYVAFD